jgi:hypothetical protein
MATFAMFDDHLFLDLEDITRVVGACPDGSAWDVYFKRGTWGECVRVGPKTVEAILSAVTCRIDLTSYLGPFETVE